LPLSIKALNRFLTSTSKSFLEPATAHRLANEFPRQGSAAWIQYKHYNENKLGLTKREHMPDGLRRLVDELSGPEFTTWLSQLTGIPQRIADPSLEGGGLHQSGTGGFLNMHADFTAHHHHPHWRRRVNLIRTMGPQHDALRCQSAALAQPCADLQRGRELLSRFPRSLAVS